MKKYFSFLLLLAACGGPSVKSLDPTSADSLSSKIVRDTFDRTPIVFADSGWWIKESYIQKLAATRSPRGSQGEGELLILPDSTLKEADGIGGFHDGVQYKLAKYGGRFYLFDMQLENKYDEVIPVSKNKIKVRASNYVYVKNHKLLESLLFKGIYTAGADTIELKEDGSISGWLKYDAYDPMIDYAGGPGMDVDEIFLAKGGKKGDEYAFKFVDDYLNIYILNCVQYDSLNHECAEVTFGKLFAELKMISK